MRLTLPPTVGVEVHGMTQVEIIITLILRPFNFDTLATHVYTYASLSQIEEAALPALTIVIAGLIPIILINRELVKT